MHDAPPRLPGAEPFSLAAAGSLRGVIVALLQATGFASAAVALYGPSGILREQIGAGRHVDLFISADEGHAQALSEAGWACRLAPVARNNLCVLARAGLKLYGDRLLPGLLDPGLRLGTSTPLLDPCGDCAWAMFERAEAIAPGAAARLAGKAQQLTGGRGPLPSRGNAYGGWIARDRVDAFLTYRTNALAARAENPALVIHELPGCLAVETVCTAALARGAGRTAQHFLDVLLGPPGRMMFSEFGFGLP